MPHVQVDVLAAECQRAGSYGYQRRGGIDSGVFVYPPMPFSALRILLGFPQAAVLGHSAPYRLSTVPLGTGKRKINQGIKICLPNI